MNIDQEIILKYSQEFSQLKYDYFFALSKKEEVEKENEELKNKIQELENKLKEQEEKEESEGKDEM